MDWNRVISIELGLNFGQMLLFHSIKIKEQQKRVVRSDWEEPSVQPISFPFKLGLLCVGVLVNI